MPVVCRKVLAQDLAPAVRRLLDDAVNTLEKLELVIRLYRARERRLTIGKLQRELELDRDDFRRSVAELTQAALIHRYGRDTIELLLHGAEDEAVMRELAAIYDSDKTRLIIAISEISMHRLRNLAGKAFADAFVIRKKYGDDEDG